MDEKCPGVKFCQFKSLESAQAFCDKLDLCRGIMKFANILDMSLGAEPQQHCTKGLGCYFPAWGKTESDQKWRKGKGLTWLRKWKKAPTPAPTNPEIKDSCRRQIQVISTHTCRSPSGWTKVSGMYTYTMGHVSVNGFKPTKFSWTCDSNPNCKLSFYDDQWRINCGGASDCFTATPPSFSFTGALDGTNVGASNVNGIFVKRGAMNGRSMYINGKGATMQFEGAKWVVYFAGQERFAAETRSKNPPRFGWHARKDFSIGTPQVNSYTLSKPADVAQCIIPSFKDAWTQKAITVVSPCSFDSITPPPSSTLLEGNNCVKHGWVKHGLSCSWMTLQPDSAR